MEGERKIINNGFSPLPLLQNLVAKHWFFIAVSALVRVSITRCWHVSKYNVCCKADTAGCMGGVKGFVCGFEKNLIMQLWKGPGECHSQNLESQAQPFEEMLYIALVRLMVLLIGISTSQANCVLLFLFNVYVDQPHRGDADCVSKEGCPSQFWLNDIYATS